MSKFPEDELDQYEDKIVQWHDKYKGNLPLHTYLGLTWEEYKNVVGAGSVREASL